MNLIMKMLCIGNMPHKTTEEEIKHLFPAYGEVESVDLIMGRSRNSKDVNGEDTR
jgi:RNA recognition motif-containing protein